MFVCCCVGQAKVKVPQLYRASICALGLVGGTDGRWLLKATPAGLAEQAAGGGGTPKRQKGNNKKSPKPKRQTTPPSLEKNCQNRPGRLAQGGEKGGGGGKEEEPRDPRRHSRYEWLSAVTRCRNSEQFCSQLELGLMIDESSKGLPQAPRLVALELSSCEKT